MLFAIMMDFFIAAEFIPEVCDIKHYDRRFKLYTLSYERFKLIGGYPAEKELDLITREKVFIKCVAFEFGVEIDVE